MSNPSEPGVAKSAWIAPVETLGLAVVVATSAALIGSVLWRASFGYDFSDEGHYLNWIAHPGVNKAAVTHFSFVYHPLYRLVGENVVWLRRANIFLTLGLGWILCYLVLGKMGPKPAAAPLLQKLPLAGLALALSTSTLAWLHAAWLPTPSYDSLALQALLVAATGILLVDGQASGRGILGWLLIGMSGWLAFMAKPTSGAGLAVVVALYLLISGKMQVKMLGLVVVSAGTLLLLSAWFIGGSPGGFVTRLIGGAEAARGFQGGYTLGEALRTDDFSLSSTEKRTLSGATLLVFLTTCLAASPRPAKRLASPVFAFLAAAGLLVAALREGSLGLAPQPFQGLQYWAVPLGAWLAALALAWKNGFRGLTRNHWALALSLVVIPWVYAFGTNSNYWAAESKAAIFWVLAGIALLRPLHPLEDSWRPLLPAAAGAQLCTGLLLFISMEHPYRQAQPMREHDSFMHLAGSGTPLRVSRGFADYVARLHQLAEAGGFKVGMPVLDLTGHYPGAVYAMGAQSLGRSWMIGGYPGSDALAMANLDRVPRDELARAWILTEPTGPRKLSLEILKRYGIDLARDYIEVGTLASPTGTFPESYQQHLWRPTR